MPFNINNNYPKPSVLNGVVVPDQSLTVSTVSVQIGTALNVATDLVTFDVQTSNVRVRWDGTAPTATTGHILYVGNGYTWPKAMLTASRFIRDTSATSDAVIWISELEV